GTITTHRSRSAGAIATRRIELVVLQRVRSTSTFRDFVLSWLIRFFRPPYKTEYNRPLRHLKEALMRRRIPLAISLALVTAAVPLLGQTSAAPVSVDPRVGVALEVVRVWLEGQRAYDQIPGISAAVVYDQDPLWAGGY